MTVTIDDTTDRLLDFLCDALDAEPEAPNLDRHLGHHLEEVARAHDEWSRHVTALRLLIGAQLVKAAVDQRTKRRRAAHGGKKNGAVRTFATRDVRAWLRAQGRDVAESGRLPNELIEEYRREHQ